MLQYVESMNKYVGFLMIYGEGNESITLRVYDHATLTEQVANNTPVVFAADAIFGDPSNPYVVSLDAGTPTPEITIITQPAPITNVTDGDIVGALTVAASVTQGATLSYQWFVSTTNSNTDGQEIVDATSANFAIPTDLTAGDYDYYCVVSATGGATPVSSSVATVVVSATPVITIDTQPAEKTEVTEGAITGSLSISASVTQGATLRYQWFASTSLSASDGMLSNTDGQEIVGANTAIFTIPATLNEGTYYYFCEVRADGTTSIRSSVATVNVLAAIKTDADMITASDFRIYPNPARMILYVVHPLESIDLLEIVDVSGRIVFRQKNFADASIDISDLVPGIYLLRAIKDEQLVVIRFVKE